MFITLADIDLMWGVWTRFNQRDREDGGMREGGEGGGLAGQLNMRGNYKSFKEKI